MVDSIPYVFNSGQTLSGDEKIVVSGTGSGDQTSGDSIPVGTIVSTYLTEIQISQLDEWLYCNGQSFDQNVYPELFLALNSTNVPDLRDMFLRGLPSSGRSLGDYQADEFKSHNHQQAQGFSASGVGSEGSTALDKDVVLKNHDGNPNQRAFFTFNRGGIETRPKNIAVNYMIKATQASSSGSQIPLQLTTDNIQLNSFVGIQQQLTKIDVSLGFDMQNNAITNLQSPVFGTDVANKNYVDNFVPNTINNQSGNYFETQNVGGTCRVYVNSQLVMTWASNQILCNRPIIRQFDATQNDELVRLSQVNALISAAIGANPGGSISKIQNNSGSTFVFCNNQNDIVAEVEGVEYMRMENVNGGRVECNKVLQYTGAVTETLYDQLVRKGYVDDALNNYQAVSIENQNVRAVCTTNGKIEMSFLNNTPRFTFDVQDRQILLDVANDNGFQVRQDDGKFLFDLGIDTYMQSRVPLEIYSDDNRNNKQIYLSNADGQAGNGSQDFCYISNKLQIGDSGARDRIFSVRENGYSPFVSDGCGVEIDTKSLFRKPIQIGDYDQDMNTSNIAAVTIQPISGQDQCLLIKSTKPGENPYARIEGEIQAEQFTQLLSSDKRLKFDIIPIPIDEKALQLKPVQYKIENKHGKIVVEEGFIAQDVLQCHSLDHCVRTSISTGFLQLDYYKLYQEIVKQLLMKNQQLEQRLSKLEQMLKV